MLPEGKKIIIEIFFLRRRTLNENRKQRTFGPAGSLVTAEMQFPQALDERGQIWAEQSGATKYFRRPAVCMMKLFVILTPPFLTFLWYKNFQLAWPKWYQSIRLGTSSEIENHFQDNRTNGVEVTNVFSKFLPKFPNFHRVRPFLRKFTEKTATAGELKFSGAIELGEI